MAIITGSCFCIAPTSSLAVDTAIVHGHGVFNENIIALDQVNILMTIAACICQVGWVDTGIFHVAGQDIMIAVTIRASRHILALTLY